VELAAPLHQQRGGLLFILVRGDGGEEVARIGEAICADRAAMGQRESAAVVFAHIGARGPVDELDLEDHAALDHADLAGRDVDYAELGAETKLVLLRDDEELAVRVEEILVAHGCLHEQHMRSHAGARLGVARRRHGAQAAHEGELLVRYRDRSPTQLADRQVALLPRRRCGAHEPLVDPAVARRVLDRGSDAIKPGALVGRLRRGERRAGQLLGVEAELDLLRRIAPDRQRTCQRLGLERVAEARHIAGYETMKIGLCSKSRRILNVHGDPPYRWKPWRRRPYSIASSPAARARSAGKSSAARL